MAVAHMPHSQPLASSSATNHDDDVMRDILQELDREREKRAELESKLKTLEREMALRADEMVISRRHYIALQEELKGYRKLVDVMTAERPAIAAAVQANMRQRIMQKQQQVWSTTTVIPPSSLQVPSLPLHVIRLLEIMPWDERAKEYAFKKEEIYEWQFYSSKQKVWLKELRQCPKMFKELSTEEPKPGVNADGSSPQKGKMLFPLLAGLESAVAAPPSQSSVLTNATITKKYNLQKGYPLPENGGMWEWVGGWRVEKQVMLNLDHSKGVASSKSRSPPRVDCDGEGWSYAMEPAFFLLHTHETCFDNPGTTIQGNKQDTVLRPVRRRKWTRQRALVDYPHASESSRCFLRLMAQHRYATLTANKMSEQLVQTKVALTEMESTQMQCKDELTTHVRELKLLLGAENKLPMMRSGDLRTAVRAATAAADRMQQEILKLMDESGGYKLKNSPY